MPELTIDESVCICESYAGTCKNGNKKGGGKGLERNCIKIFMARFWEFDLGGSDVSLPMASGHHPGLIGCCTS